MTLHQLQSKQLTQAILSIQNKWLINANKLDIEVMLLMDDPFKTMLFMDALILENDY